MIRRQRARWYKAPQRQTHLDHIDRFANKTAVETEILFREGQRSASWIQSGAGTASENKISAITTMPSENGLAQVSYIKNSQ